MFIILMREWANVRASELHASFPQRIKFRTGNVYKRFPSFFLNCAVHSAAAAVTTNGDPSADRALPNNRQRLPNLHTPPIGIR